MSFINDVLNAAEKTVATTAVSVYQHSVMSLDSKVDANSILEEAQQFLDMGHLNTERLDEQLKTISINGTKINTQELITNPQMALRSAAENLVDQQINKVVDGKIGEILQQYGIANGGKVTEELKDIVRNTIRGTENSIFRNPQIREGMLSMAQGAINDYYKAALETLENPEWQAKQLKPLNDMVEKGMGQINDLQKKLDDQLGNISGQLDKFSTKLDEISKMDIAKEINDQILGKLDISSKLNDLNSKLGMLGLDQVSLDAIGGNLNEQITNAVNGNLASTIQDSVAKLGQVNEKIAEVKQYVQKYEDFIKTEIKAFQDKAKEYIKQIETELINTVLSAVHLKLGDIGGFLKF